MIMNSITDLIKLRDTLLTITDKVYHYRSDSDAQAPYIVWAEDGQEDSIHADGKMVEQTLEGTVHYFTPNEFDPNFDNIQNALSEAGISFRLNSIQKEIETGLIHYEWVWCLG